ncbi:MAG: hypothetical protein GY708_20240, partial [Actinomycetia bacterium]|nr:hypothetical protein [Actinomycetes bacterium]
DDSDIEDTEHFTVNISDPSDGVVDGAQNIVLTQIEDNDGPGANGEWSISGDATVAEDGTAQYMVRYDGPTPTDASPVTVDLTLSFPAIAGATPAEEFDFANGYIIDLVLAAGATPGVSAVVVGPLAVRLSFGTGSPDTFEFNRPILDDPDIEGTENYRLTLDNPSSGTTVETNEDVVDTLIIDNDSASGVPEWAITGTGFVTEGTADLPEYAIGFSGVTLGVGESQSIDVSLLLPGGVGGAEAADFVDSADPLGLAIAAAIAGLPADTGGVTISFDGTTLT